LRQGFAKTNLKFTKTVIWRHSIATYQDNYSQNKPGIHKSQNLKASQIVGLASISEKLGGK